MFELSLPSLFDFNKNLFSGSDPISDMDLSLNVEDKYKTPDTVYPASNRILSNSIINDVSDNIKIDDKYLSDYKLPETKTEKRNISTALIIVYGLITGLILLKV